MNGGRKQRRASARLRLGAFGALAGVVAGLFTVPTASSAAPVQAGFDITVNDLTFILQQIRIAETHAAREAGGLGNVTRSTNLRGNGPNDIPDPSLPWGLRQVDGRNNNLVTGWSQWTGKDYASTGGGSALGAADQPFLRETDPLWRSTDVPTILPPSTPLAQTYNTTARPSSLEDADPRIISNLISDQSPNNPAAVASAAAGATPGVDGSLIIPNTAPVAGAAPYNGLFALFGQFFDHGLDLVGKTNQEVILIPLQPDDPKYVVGSPTNFMAVNRTVLDANGNGNNSTTPWIDQNQTYTSHPSHQVFLREYALNAAGKPVSTGKLDGGAIAGNIANWGEVDRKSTRLNSSH